MTMMMMMMMMMMIEVFKFLNGPLTQVYFLNMIREIEEDILRNCSKDDMQT